MGYTYLIILFAVGIAFSYRVYSKIISPIFFFYISWLLVIIVHATNFIEFNKLSDETITYVIVGGSFFFIGSLFASKVKLISPKYCADALIMSAFKKYVYALNISFVICLFGVLLFYVYHNNLPLDSEGAARINRQGMGLYRPIREMIYSVTLPLLLTIVIASSTIHSRILLLNPFLGLESRVVANKLRNKLLLLFIISCVILAIYAFLTFGRNYIFIVFSIVFSSYLLTTNNVSIKNKSFLFSAVSFIVIFVFITIKITELRGIGNGLDAYKSIVIYYTGPLSYFNEAVPDITSFEYGHMFFGGFDSFFLRPFDYIPVIRDYIPPLPLSLNDQQVPLTIGLDIRYNAFGTIMLDAYHDAGFFGIIFICTFLGFVSSYFYRKANISNNPLYLCLCTLSGVWILWSPLCWAGGFYATGSVTFWLLMLDYFAKRIRVSNK